MGGGVSKTHMPSGADAPALARPNPLSSTEVRQTVCTPTAAAVVAISPLANDRRDNINGGGGHEVTPRPPEDSAPTANPRRPPLETITGAPIDNTSTTAAALPPAKPRESFGLPPISTADGERCRRSGSDSSDRYNEGEEDKNMARDHGEGNTMNRTNKVKEHHLPPIAVSAATSDAGAVDSDGPRDDGDSPCPTEPSPTPAREGARPLAAVPKSGNSGNTGADMTPSTAYCPNARSVSPAMALTDYSTLPLRQLQSALRQSHRVLRVCLTGGPCAGKSTLLAEIQARIPQRTGYRVYCVPEAATILVTGGMRWDAAITLEQQLCLLRTQLALEDQFYALAVASGLPTIVMSDRGTMDGRAFCAPEDFAEILRRLGCTLDVLRDRYDAVIHMVTAACGAESYYNLDNPARYEDLDGARASDEKLRQMYVGHPVLRILDNSTSFDGKVERGLQLVASLTGGGSGGNCEGDSDESAVREGMTCDVGTLQKTSYFLVRRCPREIPIASATYRVRTTVLGNSSMDEMRLVQLRIMADGSRMHFFRSSRRASPFARAAPPPLPTGDAAHAFRRSHGARELSSDASSVATTQMPGLRDAIQGSTHNGGGEEHCRVTPRRNGSVAASILGPQAPEHVVNAMRISSKEYACLVNNRDPQRAVVEAEATHFVCNGANFEIVTILAPSWAAGRQTVTIEYATRGAVVATAAATAVVEGERREHEDAAGEDEMPAFPDFLEVDREVPLDSTTTAFLISHRETGPLYTSLAFAPVFSHPRMLGGGGGPMGMGTGAGGGSSLAAIGAHADTHNILLSTHSTPLRGGPARRLSADALPDTATSAAALSATPEQSHTIDGENADAGDRGVRLAEGRLPAHRGGGGSGAHQGGKRSALAALDPNQPAHPADARKGTARAKREQPPVREERMARQQTTPPATNRLDPMMSAA